MSVLSDKWINKMATTTHRHRNGQEIVEMLGGKTAVKATLEVYLTLVHNRLVKNQRTKGQEENSRFQYKTLLIELAEMEITKKGWSDLTKKDLLEWYSVANSKKAPKSKPPPKRSPSLQNQPQADLEVKKMAELLWGEIDGVNVKARQVGKGLIINGMDMTEAFDLIDTVSNFGEYLKFMHYQGINLYASNFILPQLDIAPIDPSPFNDIYKSIKRSRRGSGLNWPL